ncbi:unnamed protein product [Prorocentrum cordatum]|uniref:Uncharacterized protein n=1 Tax=Prorocentrum cordatum TaxID=2364126 RepID=A0ABN9T5R6_9DINO|nr:unnamed protein product [Polarella glacialis]
MPYNAGISACGKGETWRRAVALLSEMWEAQLEPNVISYSAGISACGKGAQWRRAVVLLSEMWEARLKPNVIILQLWDQRVREGQAMAVGFGAVQRDVRSASGAQLSYNAGISACEKGEQWQRAVALLSELRKAKLEPDVITLQLGDQRVRERRAVAAGFGAVQRDV